MKTLPALSSFLVVASLASGAVADRLALASTCQLGATTVENFEVPQDTTCTLTGTIVQGNVIVQRGGTLIAARIRVEGNVQAEGAAKVNVANSTVGGSVQIKQGGSARVVRTSIEGDLQFDAMTAPLDARYNTVGGSVQAFQNSGRLEISRNRIDGNLQCKENSPAPLGTGNIVGGNKEDQCASF
jgi:hypothetical protein